MKYLGMFVVVAWLLTACNYQPIVTPDAEGQLEAQAGVVDVSGALDVSVNKVSEQSSLALNSAGQPVVAWVEYNALSSGLEYDDKLYVKQWSGNQWVRLGDSLSNTARVDNPSVAMTNTGFSIVAYESCSPNRQNCDATDSPPRFDIFVKRWDGTKWVQLGSGLRSFSVYQALSASLTIDAQNRPVVAYSECLVNTGDFCTGYDLYVKRWDGSKWVVLGAALNVQKNVSPVISGSYALDATIAIDGSGRIIVAWQEGQSLRNPTITTPRLYAKRWDGTQWVLLGTAVDRTDTTPMCGYNGLFPPACKIPSTSIPLGSYSYKPSLAIDKKSNMPYIAYLDYFPSINDENLYVMKFDGTKWIQVSSNVDSAGSKVDNPSLSLTPDGRLMVAYDESYNSNRNIYIKVLSLGGTWGYVAARAERTISNNAYLPSLAVDVSGNAIFSYEEEVAGQQRNVYVRKYQPDVPKSWVQLGNFAIPSDGIFFQKKNPLGIDQGNNVLLTWAFYNKQDDLIDKLVAQKWNGTAWSLLAEKSVPSVPIGSSSFITFDKNGTPFASAADGTISRWNGSGWVVLGRAYPENGNRNIKSLSFNSSGNPVVLWKENTSGYVSFWNGSTFVQIGNGLISEPRCFFGKCETLAVDSKNNPVVAFLEGNVLKIQRWNGTQWVQLGGRVNGVNFSTDTPVDFVVGVDTLDRPVVVFADAKSYLDGDNQTVTANIYVKRWDGIQWVQLGSALDAAITNGVAEPNLNLDSAGNPYVVWRECTPGRDPVFGFSTCVGGNIWVKTWNGSSWVQVGNSLESTLAYPANLSIIIDKSNRPVVSYSDSQTGKIYVKRYQ